MESISAVILGLILMLSLLVQLQTLVAGRWVTMSLRVGISGHVSPAERLSYQSEAGSPKRFSAQQWIEENEVYAKRIHAFPLDGISILRNKNVIVSRSTFARRRLLRYVRQRYYVTDYSK
ncbi:hypothetical protein X777_07227 [Ooceraea biroi]|uniref:Uncharacterized protein n=1 Tax=Ooceraea biroi TaxID=2015173 RepID=A0A026WDC5_OOCBI|nr:hypothetical protein X777_07227 [Ooceraea biroi]